MRPGKTTLAVLGITALLTFSPACIPAQTADQSSAPTIKVTARETVVDVTVTDAKGNPVHGLTRAVFTLKQPVPEPEKLPPNTYSNRQPPAVSDAVNLLWLDFRNIFDDSDKPGMHQMRAKKEAKRYLQNMPAGTRFAILGSSGPTVFASCRASPRTPRCSVPPSTPWSMTPPLLLMMENATSHGVRGCSRSTK